MTTTARHSGSRCLSASSSSSRSAMSGRDVGDGRGVDRGQLDLDRPAPPTARDVDTGMDDELTEPGVEPVGIAKRRAGSARRG